MARIHNAVKQKHTLKEALELLMLNLGEYDSYCMSLVLKYTMRFLFQKALQLFNQTILTRRTRRWEFIYKNRLSDGHEQ